ncbi:hypothetical protein [Natrarchaeobaculum sulfurireducens]|uniref:Uncharacterized protein n=1 Tax=Natrarchaeobaculum sulfurireducens TaxID=2044521 RepID=A0A346PTJ8_9EURY|nr:hypothetical protein [Natrarchaeobaculum sulfurireducens]AXR82843.1 hypothetical protein AArcMg_2854 [Natrarchaeobaculum sulfurireducens]
MRTLTRRARRLYREEGARKVTTESIRFVVRAVRHSLGTRGLYGSRRYLTLLRWSNAGRGRFDAVANPYKIIHTAPTEIAYVTGRRPNPGRFQWQDLRKVQGGDWDRSDERVEDLPVVQALRQRFEDGTDWEDIEFIQHVLEQAEHEPLLR